MIVPFRPAQGQTVNIDVSASNQRVQLTSSNGLTQVRVMNNGTVTAWYEHGTDNTVVASTASTPIPAGGVEVISCEGPVWMAAIAAGSTGKIYFTPGEGV